LEALRQSLLVEALTGMEDYTSQTTATLLERLSAGQEQQGFRDKWQLTFDPADPDLSSAILSEDVTDALEKIRLQTPAQVQAIIQQAQKVFSASKEATPAPAKG